jgi:hypothetical protein
VAFYAGHGITVERVLTDNGNPYRSRDFRTACAELAVSPRRTRPYRPQTNGKAERFIRTLLSEWAYVGAFRDTAERVASLPRFVDFYDRSRPHWSQAGQPPMSRAPANNLSGKNRSRRLRQGESLEYHRGLVGRPLRAARCGPGNEIIWLAVPGSTQVRPSKLNSGASGSSAALSIVDVDLLAGPARRCAAHVRRGGSSRTCHP